MAKKTMTEQRDKLTGLQAERSRLVARIAELERLQATADGDGGADIAATDPRNASSAELDTSRRVLPVLEKRIAEAKAQA